MAATNASGQINLTTTDGSTLTGRYAPDGSTYIVLNDGNTLTGLFHPSGAMNAVATTDLSTWSAPNGSMYVINTADGYHPITPGNPVAYVAPSGDIILHFNDIDNSALWALLEDI